MRNLTELVKSPHNPVGQFFRTALPGRGAAREANAKLSKCNTVVPEGDQTGYPWMLAGTAFDYRARFFFLPEFDFGDTVALGRLPSGSIVSPSEECRNVADFLSSAGKSLTSEKRSDDDYLARLCVIAAHLEGPWRSGIVGEWLLSADKMEPERIMESIPDNLADDITQMAQRLKFAFPNQMPERIIPNPVFGNRHIGIGADGDIILDDCLIDIKATVSPKVTQEMLHQLVGYAFLGGNDRLGIRRIGLYMARQGALVVWTVPELLMLLGASNTDIRVLRTRFEKAARLIQKCG